MALALHFALGGVYLAILPLWGAVPDEPLHYSTIKYDAEFVSQPTITDPRPWAEPLAVYCFTADPVGAGGHGPLYYWSSVPLFWLTRSLTVEQQLYVLRAWTLLLSALMIPLGWLVLRRLFPADPELVAAGTLLIAVWPHRLLMSAVIYNDIACATATFYYLWLLLRAAGDEGRPHHWFWAGAALGLAFLAKRVALVTFPGSLVLALLQARRRGDGRRVVLTHLALWALGFAVVGGWWLLRDYQLYGALFPTEPGFEARHASWLEQWYALPRATFWWKIRYILRGLWLSLWSQVGWVPLDVAGWRPVALTLYSLFGLGTLLTVLGYLGGLKSRWGGLSAETRDALTGAVVMALGMAYGALHWVMQYSFHNNEETGKHAQAILVCLVALAAAACRWLFGRRAGGAMRLAVMVMLVFNLAAIVRLQTFLIPTYRPRTPALAHERVRDLPSGAAPGIWHRYRVPGVTQRGGLVDMPTSSADAWHG
ncbi:MAG: glycosyltransferase family 39 protein [Armatimonadetes bacterium]|nr:glycosyltransferase family 39 protein [Armatimonadota bacterium]